MLMTHKKKANETLESLDKTLEEIEELFEKTEVKISELDKRIDDKKDKSSHNESEGEQNFTEHILKLRKIIHGPIWNKLFTIT